MYYRLGVAQLLNKVDSSPFDEHDDQLFEAFTIFCGLGINNCQLFDELERSSAKQAVALEVSDAQKKCVYSKSIL